MPHPTFDRSRLILKPLAERVHDMLLEDVLPLDEAVQPFDDPSLQAVTDRIIKAHQTGSQVILMMGAHVIKRGLSRFVIDLMERGILTHIGINGAGAIHDFELAMIGATTESVARYIQEGQFGLWQETGLINRAISDGVIDGLGIGEAVGRMIHEGTFSPPGNQHPGSRLPPGNSGHKPRWDWLRHHPRTPKLQRQRSRGCFLSGFSDHHPNHHRAAGRCPAQFWHFCDGP